MNKKLIQCLALALGAVSLMGCRAQMIGPSDAKTAYMVRQGMTGTSVYHCSAESGKPICKKVVEK